MHEVSEFLIQAGEMVTPFSFVIYVIIRPIAYRLHLDHYMMYVKVAWYIAAGLGALQHRVEIETLVALLALIEALDLLFAARKEAIRIAISKTSEHESPNQ